MGEEEVCWWNVANIGDNGRGGGGFCENFDEGGPKFESPKSLVAAATAMVAVANDYHHQTTRRHQSANSVPQVESEDSDDSDVDSITTTSEAGSEDIDAGDEQQIQDLLQVPLQYCWYENIISRTCYYAWYVLTRPLDFHYADVQKQVLDSERVKKAVENAAFNEYRAQCKASDPTDESQLKELLAAHSQKAFDQLNQLRSCISSSLMRIAGWILYRLLSRIFTSIQFSKTQIERIRECRKKDENIPILYLPLHRSHLDYILISFLLSMNDIAPPLVAAGDNLLIPFFGNLMRGLGAFFIKRKTDSNKHRDEVYQAILHSYITENLRVGNSMEFFIEGSRTRTGKVLMPKLGLLSIVVDAILEGAVKDVYVVPVSISYEKLIDGSFIDEQLGKSKQFENFGDASKAIWAALHSNYGIARVDFSKPFLLKEYLSQVINTESAIESAGQSPSVNLIYKCVACAGAESLNKTNHSQMTKMIQDNFESSDLRRQCIESVARHVLFDAYKESALMSTHLMAFLLLTKYRKGTTLEQLVQELEWLCEVLCQEKDQSLSVPQDCKKMIRQAMFYLGKELITTEKVSMKFTSWNRWNGTGTIRQPVIKNGKWDQDCDPKTHIEIIYLKPVLKLQNTLQLQYYANTCATLFHMESVLALALFSFINVDISSLIFDPTTYISNLAIDKQEFLNRCKQICFILQHEFVFHKTCETIEQAIDREFQVFVRKNILVLMQSEGEIKSRVRVTVPVKRRYKSKPYKHFNTTTNNNNAFIGNLNHKHTNIIESCILEEEEEELETTAHSMAQAGDRGHFSLFDNSNKCKEFSILLTAKNCQLLNFYRSILEPYIESYWLAVSHLATLRAKHHSVIELSALLATLLDNGQQMIRTGQLHYEEAISCDTFRNSLKYLERVEAIKKLDCISELSGKSKFLPTRLFGSLSAGSKPNPATAVQGAATNFVKKRKVKPGINIVYESEQMAQLAQSIRRYANNMLVAK